MTDFRSVRNRKSLEDYHVEFSSLPAKRQTAIKEEMKRYLAEIKKNEAQTQKMPLQAEKKPSLRKKRTRSRRQ